MLTGIAICLAFLMILSFILPVDIIFSLQSSPSFARRISVRLMFGLIRLPIPSRFIRSPFRRPSRRKEYRGRRSQSRLRRFMILFKGKGFFRRVLRFISDMYRAVHIRILSLYCVLGLDDPADTGRLWAVIGPISNIIADLYLPDILIEPDFTAETFFVEGKGEIRVIPVRILYIVTLFLMSPSTIRALWAIMTQRPV